MDVALYEVKYIIIINPLITSLPNNSTLHICAFTVESSLEVMSGIKASLSISDIWQDHFLLASERLLSLITV